MKKQNVESIYAPIDKCLTYFQEYKIHFKVDTILIPKLIACIWDPLREWHKPGSSNY